MSNKYLSYDDQRAPRVREMFSRLAKRYDLVNDVAGFGMHRKWKREAVRLAIDGIPRRPARVLDLCCGTGDMSFLAEELGASSVVGADFTLPMLSIAARRRAREERRRPGFVAADALHLPFRDGAFDAVTVGYGLRNVADPGKALREMRRGARAVRPDRRSRLREAGQPGREVALLRLLEDDDARRRLDLPRRPGDPACLYIPARR